MQQSYPLAQLEVMRDDITEELSHNDGQELTRLNGSA